MSTAAIQLAAVAAFAAIAVGLAWRSGIPLSGALGRAAGRATVQLLAVGAVLTAIVDRPWLARIRERGYDISYGENHPNINGVSGPLLTTDDHALGSITVAGPADRLTEATIPRLAGPLLAACRELSAT